jgi:hypothetical protein
MTTDYRALCIELTDCLEKSNWPLRHRYVFRQWIDIAHAALADGPAVPDGREPASVVEQPRHSEIRLLYCQTLGLRCDPDSIGPDPVKFARAVLTRWGNPAPQPVPVSEQEVSK